MPGQVYQSITRLPWEQMAVRRFLLRGLANVAAEWTALATAFNLRTLWLAWRSRRFNFLPGNQQPQADS